MKAIDLFAGAGGLSLAAHQLGIDVLAAIEFDQAAAKTYQLNLIERLGHKTKFFQQDILTISPKALRLELGVKKKELSLLLGGPPCQGFSSHRIKNAGVDDPRNKLLLRYFDFVKEFKPQLFLVENVAGLLWERHAKYLDDFKELAKSNNYKILHCGTLNAKDYGVPQNRKRVFILGVREDLTLKNDFKFPPNPSHFSPKSKEAIRQQLPSWRTASSVFEKLTPELIKRYIKEHFRPHTELADKEASNLLKHLEYGSPVDKDDPCNRHMQPTLRMTERFESTRLNGSREDAAPEFELNCHSDGYAGHKDVYGRIFIHQPANTITTGCNNPSKGRFVHPWKNHGITLRHAARIQTFPDNYIFTGSSTDQAKQIGNAVPPMLGKALIEAIINGIE
ncbi:DNA cytosine methyltransferase [Xenorhabdus bovienii]|uniref:DNA cytosine methyltransferase n=1 Tax=Xenorhabdus bovienii TaxID=40576 RepID=UPI002158039B|nr:DNA cytosine methyltransferase [Xenorhabdus bovienii]